jgi:glycosyltransferase involved in cell wall biosynthesis
LISCRDTSDLNLVLVGDGSKRILRNVKESGIQDRVKLLSGLAAEDLCALYSGATAFLFPSLCEGFGWPIIEAQACGCPVFTTNLAPMSEIGGDTVIYIEQNDHQKAVRTILENLERLDQIGSAGIMNARRFSTTDMLAAYIQLYGRALNAGRTVNWQNENPGRN